MLLLLGILKRNNKYFMNIVNTDKEINDDGYQFINPYILNQCVNINVHNFLSNKQNPKEYLRGEFDVNNLIVDDESLRKRVNDYQIISIYYDQDNKPCLYKSIDRAGNISMHDISEFMYTKNSSILGDDINHLPDFVQHKSLEDAYEYFKNQKLSIADMPVGLAKYYLTLTKGFKEGSHTITKVNHGVPLSVHEYMLFNGTVTMKLIEYVTKDRKVYLTKQDNISNPYPKERTVGFLPSPIVLLGSNRLMKNFCRFGVNTEFTFFNNDKVKLVIPFGNDYIELYEKYMKSKDVHTAWKLNSENNLPEDIYSNILPSEIFKLPKRFYRDMKNMPFSVSRSYRLEEENDNVEKWMHTVSLLLCMQYYSDEFKKRLMPILKNYQVMYEDILKRLVGDIGPRDTLVVMKWFKEHVKREINNIVGSDINVVDNYKCLFTFRQNDFDLPESLGVYKEDTIVNYGGLEKLKMDFELSSNERKTYIINSLEKLEKNLEDRQESEIKDGLCGITKKLS